MTGQPAIPCEKMASRLPCPQPSYRRRGISQREARGTPTYHKVDVCDGSGYIGDACADLQSGLGAAHGQQGQQEAGHMGLLGDELVVNRFLVVMRYI